MQLLKGNMLLDPTVTIVLVCACTAIYLPNTLCTNQSAFL